MDTTKLNNTAKSQKVLSMIVTTLRDSVSTHA